MVGLDQWSRREEGKARSGQGRAGQQREECWNEYFWPLSLISSLPVCRLWCDPLHGATVCPLDGKEPWDL